MTRARTDLQLIEPLKYYVTQQASHGDKHVYGARSRFLTRQVLNHLAATTWPGSDGQPSAASSAPPDVRVDVAAALRDLW
jgi:DNA helicase-2/ATP-dependent DNA helicase PcrA